MDFNLSTDQQKLMDELDAWLDGCGFDRTYFTEHFESESYPQEFYKAVFMSPFGRLGLPEAYGGKSASLTDLVLVCMKFGERGFPYTVGKTIGPMYIVNFGNDEQMRDCMNILSTGTVPYALCFTEPLAGSDSDYRMTAEPIGDGKVRLNGEKTMIMHADYAPYFIVIARNTDIDDTPFNSMSIYVVPSWEEGVAIKSLKKIGGKLYTDCSIMFKNVEIPESCILGEKGGGFTVMMRHMEMERTLLAAYNYAQAYEAYSLACDYANKRLQFGKPIGTNQLIQEKIVDMRIRVDNMRRMVLEAAWKYDNGQSLRLDSSLIKLYTARSAFQVIDDAFQIFGGRSYYEGNRIGQLWRDIREIRISGGSDEMMIRGAGKVILREFEKKAKE